MKLLSLLVLSAFLGASSGAFAADVAEELTPVPSERALPAAAIPDRYIIQLVAGADAGSVAAGHGVLPQFLYQHAVRGFAGTVPPGRLAALRADSRVLHVIPDRRVTAIGKPTGGKDSGGATEIVPEGVKRIGAAPESVGYTGSDVGVAVLDTGVDFNHGDLKTAVNAFTAFGVSAQDNNGHGTHVAGIIAASRNGRDVVGVAPNATIYAVKVLDASGSGSDAAVTAGIDWVYENAPRVSPRIRVVNMSLGRAGSIEDNPVLHAAIIRLRNSGITVVVAAGNDPSLEISQQVPSAYPEVLAIASTTAKDGTNQSRFFSGVIKADTASYFTSDGRNVTVSAPGEDQSNITKAGFIQSVGILSTKLGGGTTRMSGTSMAAPHVAGVAALIHQKLPGFAPNDLQNLISGSASNHSAPFDSPTSSYSFDGVREGVVDAQKTLSP